MNHDQINQMLSPTDASSQNNNSQAPDNATKSNLRKLIRAIGEEDGTHLYETLQSFGIQEFTLDENDGNLRAQIPQGTDQKKLLSSISLASLLSIGQRAFPVRLFDNSLELNIRKITQGTNAFTILRTPPFPGNDCKQMACCKTEGPKPYK